MESILKLVKEILDTVNKTPPAVMFALVGLGGLYVTYEQNKTLKLSIQSTEKVMLQIEDHLKKIAKVYSGE